MTLGRSSSGRRACSFNDYLNNFRIEEAKKLLKTTNLLVFEIAFKVGYKEQKTSAPCSGRGSA